MKYFWAIVLVGVFYSSKAVGLQQIKLEIYDAVQDEVDETTVNLDYGTTDAYNYTEDSKKILSGVLQSPQLFSLTTDNIYCLINSHGPFAASVVIPIGYRSYNTGSYTIRLKSTDNTDATSLIRLEDKVTGNMIDLQTQDYTFNSSGQQLITNRFYLHVSRPAVISTLLADCNNQNGTIVIDQDSTIVWDQCQLFDSQSQLVSTLNNVGGTFSFQGLNGGAYSIAFIYGSYVATRQVSVTGQQVSVTIGVSTQNIVTGQEVQFSSWATNALNYEWNFGDGTIVTNIANPQVAYYVPGTYNVVLTVSNAAGCQGFAYLTVVVGQATGINDATTVSGKAFYANGNIVIENTTATSYAIANLLGQVVAEGSITSASQAIPMQQYAKGIYVVQLKDKDAVNGIKLSVY